MTELETMKRARMYLNKLSHGVDPITEEPLQLGHSLHSDRLFRCFAYVTQVLDRVIVNGGASASPGLSFYPVTQWLLDQGLLREQEHPTNGNKVKLITEAGASLGLKREERTGVNGTYSVVVYSANAQQFILDHIQEIIDSL